MRIATRGSALALTQARWVADRLGGGDYDGLGTWMEQHGTIPADLQGDLDRLKTLGIPVDVVFEQGLSVLGLQ